MFMQFYPPHQPPTHTANLDYPFCIQGKESEIGQNNSLQLPPGKLGKYKWLPYNNVKNWLL